MQGCEQPLAPSLCSNLLPGEFYELFELAGIRESPARNDNRAI